MLEVATNRAPLDRGSGVEGGEGQESMLFSANPTYYLSLHRNKVDWHFLGFRLQ